LVARHTCRFQATHASEVMQLMFFLAEQDLYCEEKDTVLLLVDISGFTKVWLALAQQERPSLLSHVLIHPLI
jgi:hypothetical protein